MTFIISAPARSLSSPNIFGLLLKYLARARAMPDAPDAAELSARLRYDVGLSDRSPERLARGRAAGFAGEMMHRNF